jgi:hypothetical protein|tara:strand:- start:298 stop:480 length:183 start_codon:yes stop_codon:yes gene_type:complete
MITIDGQKYTKEKMSDDQLKLFGIISKLNDEKKELIFKAEQKEHSIQHYIGEFKKLTKKE